MFLKKGKSDYISPDDIHFLLSRPEEKFLKALVESEGNQIMKITISDDFIQMRNFEEYQLLKSWIDGLENNL